MLKTEKIFKFLSHKILNFKGFFLVELSGVEPLTSWLPAMRSSQLS
jgi:hypothetical protein